MIFLPGSENSMKWLKNWWNQIAVENAKAYLFMAEAPII